MTTTKACRCTLCPGTGVGDATISTPRRPPLTPNRRRASGGWWMVERSSASYDSRFKIADGVRRDGKRQHGTTAEHCAVGGWSTVELRFDVELCSGSMVPNPAHPQLYYAPICSFCTCKSRQENDVLYSVIDTVQVILRARDSIYLTNFVQIPRFPQVHDLSNPRYCLCVYL
jgi:hypothetical protein